MGNTFDTATGNKVTSATTNTWSHTVAVQSNRVLLVSVDAGQAVTGVAYNAVAMTSLGVVNYNSANEHLSLWYLLAPATGANNVVATVGSATFIIGVSSSYYGVAQTSTFGTFASNSGTTGAASTNTVVTTSSTQLVIDAVNNGAASTDTATASQTKRFQPATSGAALGDIAASGSNMTLTWSFTSSVWAQVSVAMNPSGGAVTHLRISDGGYGGVFS
jgi:hypothetical protein